MPAIILGTPMNADVTPMNADNSLCRIVIAILVYRTRQVVAELDDAGLLMGDLGIHESLWSHRRSSA